MDLLSAQEKTKERICNLESYFGTVIEQQKRTLLDSFKSEKVDFRTVLPHVGEHYDCLINKKNQNAGFRILIMGLEALKEEKLSISERTEQILRAPADEKKNPHMKGTALLLQYLIGNILEYKLTENGENIDNKHIFNYFALSNWHITGCFKEGTNKAKRTAQMNKIAMQNFLKEIEVLKPSIVILQSKTIWLEHFTKKYNEKDNARWVGLDSKHYSESVNSSNNFMIYVPDEKNIYKIPVIKFTHPSDRGKKAHPWYLPKSPYFEDVIKTVLADVIGNYGKYIQPLD